MVNGRRLTRPANSVQAAVFELFARTAGAGVVAPIPARRFNPSSRRLAAKFSGKWRVDIREVVNGVMLLAQHRVPVARVAQGAAPKRSTVHDYLSLWTGMARWIASIMCSTSSAERKPQAKQAPRPASLTA